VRLVFLTTDAASTQRLSDLHLLCARRATLAPERTPLVCIEQVSPADLDEVARAQLKHTRAVAALGGPGSVRLEELAHGAGCKVLSRPDAAALRSLCSAAAVRGLRLLIVLHNGTPGGTENYACGLAAALCARGVDVSIFYPNVDSVARPELCEEQADRTRIFRLRVSREFYLQNQIENPVIERIFRELLQRERFHVVHFQHTWLALPFSLIPTARDLGARICLTLHDAWFMCHQTHLLRAGSKELCSGPETLEKCIDCFLLGRSEHTDPRQRSAIYGFLSERSRAARRALDACDIVTTPSRFLRDSYAENGFGDVQITVAPLGLEEVERVEPRPREHLSFGYMGTISELKDPCSLARAFRRVHGDTRLTFFGTGTQTDMTELAAACAGDERIRLAGAYRPEEIGRVLSEIDVLVLTSRSENYPLVIREALSVGIPTIASPIGGVPEIVEHGKNGLLFDPGDEDALAAHLQTLVDEPSRLQQLRDGIGHVKTMEDDADEWLERYYASVEEGEPDA
jgi:glycosyltransferase involved in cell wall biosynthesis